MAEQVSHNVVNGPESASASALADAAANEAPTAVAEHGTDTSPNTESNPPNIATSMSTDVTTPNEPVISDRSAETATLSAAKPSAGETADKGVASVLAPSPPQAAAQTVVDGGEHLDTLSVGEGVADDGSTADLSADHSAHSDTDGSRGDAAEHLKDGNNHVRTNSVKRPTTFSKVSVTKAFMAKSATPTPVPSKLGEKPSAVGAGPQLVAKPRLVAKLGPSLQKLQPARLGTDSPGGLEATTVWNKNRPAPTPSSKHFTDEELKQQYGIHLATRLQADEDGKESKWADIDDDEDDWTPETVVWMDGTKSTVNAADIPVPAKEPAPAGQPPAKPAEPVRPMLALKKASESGPPKTILKPGQQIKQANQQGPTTSTGEKPSLKAKSPAPAPSKSPWAPLPPIDAVSPLTPPVQQQPQPQYHALPTQDARAYEPAQPPQPAREIAADTFDRSWREGEGGARELFNSANGRYEPAPEGRRSSVKPDSISRKPAVLQRPSHSGAAPAEPSAAFQSRTSGPTDGSPWPRRRGSSVSQGSMPPGRRFSISKPADIDGLRDRRPSNVSGQDARASPLSARNEPGRPTFAQQSTWEQQMPPRPDASAPAQEMEDPVKVQERVMREKRELAIKRRKEEEEKLEKEKSDRLKAKLAALGNAGKSKKERDAEAAASAAVVQAPATSGEQPSLLTKTNVSTSEAAKTPEVSSEPALLDNSTSIIETQPLPAKLEASARAVAPSAEEQVSTPLAAQVQPSAPTEAVSASSDTAQRQTSRGQLSPSTTTRTPFGQQVGGYKPAASAYSSPGDRQSQAFSRSPLTSSDAFAPWPTSGAGGNVWGSSGIGNGTFGKASGFAPLPMIHQTTSTLPPPPGMDRAAQSTRISPQAFSQETHSPSLQQQQLGEQRSPFPPPGIESRAEASWGQSRARGVSPAPGLGRQAHSLGVIAPPSRAQNAQRPDPISAWANAAQRLPQQYAMDADAERTMHSEAPAPRPSHTIKETFRQTSSATRLGGPRRYEKTEYTIHDAQGSRSVSSHSPAPPSAQTQPVGPLGHVANAADAFEQSRESTVRLPDISMNSIHNGLPVQQPPIAPPPARAPAVTAYASNVRSASDPLPPVVGSKEASPPSFETAHYPISGEFNGRHPHVRLPPPPPVVKLPPALSMSPNQQHASVMMPPRTMSNNGFRPLAATEAWQARFNGLFGRTTTLTEVPPSPPRTPPKMAGQALEVAALSRGSMDDVHAKSSATVSLPQRVATTATKGGAVIDRNSDVTSKPSMEHIFNEELSFGSLPIVHVPRPQAYLNHSHGPSSSYSTKSAPSAVYGQTIPDGANFVLFAKNPMGYYVNLPLANFRPRLVRSRKAGFAATERKVSGKGGRGHKAGVEHGHEAVVPNGAPSGPMSRKASAQKVNGASPASTPDKGTPTMTGEVNKKKHGKPDRAQRNRHASVKAAVTAS